MRIWVTAELLLHLTAVQSRVALFPKGHTRLQYSDLEMTPKWSLEQSSCFLGTLIRLPTRSSDLSAVPGSPTFNGGDPVFIF